MQQNRDKIIARIIELEDGYVNDFNDSGGETKYGISKAAYPSADIKNLTMDMATQIYRVDYWEAVRGDELPSGLDLLVMDCAVNCGVYRAVLLLQEALRAKPDGILGPKTMEKLRGASSLSRLISKYVARRGHYYGTLDDFGHFGLGWMDRLAQVHQMAIRDLVLARTWEGVYE